MKIQMKQIVLTALCLFFIGSLQAQDEQYSIIVKKSADWCPNCGGWAWPVFEDIVDEMEGRNGIPILMHHTGGLANDASIAITDNLGGNYQPEFFLDTEIQNMTPSNAEEKIGLMKDAVDLNASLGSFMGIDIDHVSLSEDGTTLTAEISHHIYDNEVEGDFSIGLYLIQNNIMHNQSGQGNVLQPKLLTASFTEEPFGTAITVEAGNFGSVNSTLSMDAPSTLSIQDGDTELVAIIWRWVDTGQKTVFNADHWTEGIEQVSSTDDLTIGLQGLKTLFRADELQISFSADQAYANVNLSLIDVAGRKVVSQQVEILAGENNLEISTNNLTSGMYVLNMNIGNEQITQKVFKK